jgi:hypothetical protein
MTEPVTPVQLRASADAIKANGNGAAAIKAEPIAIDTSKPVKAIPKDSIKLAEFAQNAFEVIVTGCDDPKELMHPDYWPNGGALFKPFDLVRCRDALRRWWAELLVIESDIGRVRLFLLRSTPLPKTEQLGEARCPPNWTITEDPAGRGGFIGQRRDPKSGAVTTLDSQTLPFPSRESCLRAILDHASVRQVTQ